MSESFGATPQLGPQKGQRVSLGVDALVQSFLDNLFFVQGRSVERATVNDLYVALAHTVRDRIVERWMSTLRNYHSQDVRVVCYLSTLAADTEIKEENGTPRLAPPCQSQQCRERTAGG